MRVISDTDPRLRIGVVVLHEVLGRSGPEPDAPAPQLDVVFPITSMTKPITATATMLLLEEGLLGLNRPVQEYLPAFVGAGKGAVMVHHLLTHTSGLRDEDLNEHALAKLRSGVIAPGEPSPLDAFPAYRYFGAVHDAPLWKPPGVEMAYCTYNYGLLAEVVRRVTGQPAERFVHQRVLSPLGMASTSYTGVPPERIGRVVRWSPDPPFGILNRPDLLAAVAGGASACSTALDLAQFCQLFLIHRRLRRPPRPEPGRRLRDDPQPDTWD